MEPSVGAPQRSHPRLQWFGWALCAATLIAGCGDDDDPGPYDACRFEPEVCHGETGSFCDTDRDCYSGVCCTSESNCRGGMCTYSCRDDRDCPPDMACEHDVCFFRCSSDRDCAVGQSCEHGKTVCEWP
jgi:hypothetical protein